MARAASNASPAPRARASSTHTPSVFTPPTYTRDRSLPPEALLSTEWVLTNGLGGFAMGNCLMVPQRRYHGLLVAATHPPVGRIVALSTVVERLVLNPGAPGESAVELSTFEFNPGAPVLHPAGHRSFVRFTKGLDVRFDYEASGARASRSVHLHQRANAVTVSYRVSLPAGTPARLEVRPLLAMRDIHWLLRRNEHAPFTVRTDGARGVAVTLEPHTCWLGADSGRFEPDEQWWYDFYMRIDHTRAQNHAEDLFSPGVFVYDLPAGTGEHALGLHARIGAAPAHAPEVDRLARVARLAEHLSAARELATGGRPERLSPRDDTALAELVTAADDFVVARAIPGQDPPDAPTGTTIIAGYPWFSDWGRDTLISLRGLLISTGRIDQARTALINFARHRRDGVIPNHFSEGSGDPVYNTIDASMWFLQAACDFYATTNDQDAWRGDLLPACLDIVAHYRRGTVFNIGEDPIDRLITGGTEGTQLTWMDAMRDGVVFTPRHGKCVEINALWHSGLRRLSTLMAPADPVGAANLNDLAEAVARSFRSAFWDPRRRCLHDRLTPTPDGRWTPSHELRPNQIFAVSLPHSPLSPEQQRAVVQAVRERLHTPVGLRTLDPADGRYKGRFHGPMFERDEAYHNGTVWPWLLGPFVEAVLRVGEFSPEARAEARELIDGLLAELDRPAGTAPGQLVEVYDGDATPEHPRTAGGCPAQAWSVAEALRVLILVVRGEPTRTP